MISRQSPYFEWRSHKSIVKEKVKHFGNRTIINCAVMVCYALLFALIFNQAFIKEYHSDRRERKDQENEVWIIQQELHSKKLEKHRQKMCERREAPPS